MEEKKRKVRRINPKSVRMSILEPLNLSENRIRFLCTHDGKIYRLNMGNNMYREFTSETLPARLKEQIGLINAFDWDKLHSENSPSDPLRSYQSNTELYDTIVITGEYYYPEVCADIGWRVRDRYALIVPLDYFIELKGGVLAES